MIFKSAREIEGFLEEHPNQKIYAFGYKTNDNKESKANIAKPYECEIEFGVHGRYYVYGLVYKVLKSGKRSSTSVQSNARCFATSMEEAVRGYNDLVQGEIDKLNELIEGHKKAFLEVV